MIKRKSSRLSAFLLFIIINSIAPVRLQAQNQPVYPVTDDEVNAVAGKMYCPVCENIPLDDCGTVTCQQWKEEIRQQLSDGKSAQEIIDGFVQRFGNHVLGIPQDPILRALSFIAPILGGIIALIIGILTFLKWRNHQRYAPGASISASYQTIGESGEEKYRKQIEQDLARNS